MRTFVVAALLAIALFAAVLGSVGATDPGGTWASGSGLPSALPPHPPGGKATG